MSVQLDQQLQQTGTRFRIFPQPRYLPSFAEPETVYVSVPPGEIEAGPADARMFVVDAKNKAPYSEAFWPPQYTGEALPPVQPGPDGHFDHLDPNSRAFSAATMYATVRRTLDIWEGYFGGKIAWHFDADFERLELIPLIEWDNAQSGYGFLEFGYGRRPSGGIDHSRPYCENFDVLSHELGHSIIFSRVGVPRFKFDPGIDYGGMHESAGDLVALIAVLHFDSVVDHILQKTCGNLFSVNELQRMGELSESREIRTAFNYARMSDVGAEPHDRSLPLTGGVFDIMVEVFQKALVDGELISADLARRSSMDGVITVDQLGALQAEFNAAYAGRHDEFKAALLSARDYLGELLAITWDRISPDFLTYHAFLRALLESDRELTGGAHQETIRSCFAWRQIKLPKTSWLMKTHTLEDCRGHHAPAALPEMEEVEIRRTIEALDGELQRRMAERRPPLAAE